ncbi:hypothetical protein BDV12DRAFT_169211 [Aspergillus spectabilis]
MPSSAVQGGEMCRVSSFSMSPLVPPCHVRAWRLLWGSLACACGICIPALVSWMVGRDCQGLIGRAERGLRQGS